MVTKVSGLKIVEIYIPKVSGLKIVENYILCVPCQAGLLFFRKKSNKKNTFCVMILTSRPPVNFEFDIFHPRKIVVSKFYNRVRRRNFTLTFSRNRA